MSKHPDPIAAGLERGWRVIDSASADLPQQIDCDVAIIGTGAGGGISAEILAKQGLKVVLIEEGPLRSSRDFNMLESEAYPQLYQESAARKTADKAINILQGRCVGGSTTVNWTSSFRTPPATLNFWRDRFDLKGFDANAMAPYFAQAERRLGIAPWALAPNENNDLLRRGALKLGISSAMIQRNVKQCANLGYCGVGCPINAKQSMLVTTIPTALDHQAVLLTKARAQTMIFEGGTQGRKIAGIEVLWMDQAGLAATPRRTVVKAQHFVLAAGSINSPALLLRSHAPDPHKLAGKRTFLHPTVISAALFKQRVDGFQGAPQTVYSDHFLEAAAIDGPLGYKLEAPPLHPLLFATTMHGFGQSHRLRMQQLANTHAQLALLRDGFHPQSAGGSVNLRSDGTPLLDYPLNDIIFEAIRRAWLSMAELQFAAGALEVSPVHELADNYRDWSSARAAITALPLKPLLTRVVSAHVMGGCPISDDERLGLTRPDGIHHHIDNLSIHDGSIFPTSIGANPQLSIYGFATRLTLALAAKLTGKTGAALA